MSFSTCVPSTPGRAVALAALVTLAAAGLHARPTSSEPPPLGAAAQSARPVLASAGGETPGLRVDITELRRTSGDTVTLRMTIVNQSKDALVAGVFKAALIDLVGKRKYFVARDSANACVCSGSPYVSAGKSLNVWAKFSAPPADVERVTVEMPGFMPAEDVPIGR